jgi:hypothetical protein
VNLTMRARPVPQHRRPSAKGSPEGNERLTAMTGAVLLVGFAVEGATILELHRLLWLHFAVGFLLIGPVVLKIGATLYRFVRYYTRSEPYLRKGPPAPLLRLLGPLVILTSIAVLGTGVMLAVAGPGPGIWLFLHKGTFIVWFGVMTIHVCAYAPRLPRLLGHQHSASTAPASVAGAPARYIALACALAGGIAVAAFATHLSSHWNSGFGLH